MGRKAHHGCRVKAVECLEKYMTFPGVRVYESLVYEFSGRGF